MPAKSDNTPKRPVRTPGKAATKTPARGQSLDELLELAKQGLRLVPVLNKAPNLTLGKGWQSKASSSPETIKHWYEQWPEANWGVLVGGDTGLICIDIDGPSHGDDQNGHPTWNDITQGMPEIVTPTWLSTSGDGKAILLKKPQGRVQEKIEGIIEIRGFNGAMQQVLPLTPKRYIHDFRTPIAEVPEWLLPWIVEQQSEPTPQSHDEHSTGDDMPWLDVESYLNYHGLDFNRRAPNNGWTSYEFSKCPLNDDGHDEDGTTALRQHENGALLFKCFHAKCEGKKWQQFKDRYDPTNFWMNRGPKGTVPLAPRRPKPHHYSNALTAMGYKFTLNEMNNRVYVNGSLISDALEAYIMVELRERGYDNFKLFQQTYLAEAYKNRFHPIRDYLNSLKWDGEDYISKLGSYVIDQDSLFTPLLRKWLVGAVEKALKPSAMAQNPVLILSGAQNLGKSVLTQFLCSMMPEYFVASDVRPDDKDHKIMSFSKFVWEIKEFGSSIRRADIEALKAFIDATSHDVRAAYGRYEIQKNVTASYIGTINPNGVGFLNDPTGNRRYRVIRLVSINWDYSNEVDINQVWAQAVHLYRQGEHWSFSKDDADLKARMDEVLGMFTFSDPIESKLADLFEVTMNPMHFVSSRRVLELAHYAGLTKSATDIGDSMRISKILHSLGAESGNGKVDGDKRVRGWKGLVVTEQGQKIESDHADDLYDGRAR